MLVKIVQQSVSESVWLILCDSLILIDYQSSLSVSVSLILHEVCLTPTGQDYLFYRRRISPISPVSLLLHINRITVTQQYKGPNIIHHLRTLYINILKLSGVLNTAENTLRMHSEALESL